MQWFMSYPVDRNKNLATNKCWRRFRGH